MTLSFLLRRAALFTLLWVVLVEGDPVYFWYAVLTVPVAVAASVGCLPPAERASDTAAGQRHSGLANAVPTTRSVAAPSLRLTRRARAAGTLLVWLLWQSVRGGVDVAARALTNPVRVDPVEVVVPVRLTGGARAVTLAVLGLTPGAIVSEVREHEAVIHAVSADVDAAQTWRELERRVLSVVGDPVEEPRRSSDAQ